MHILKGKHGGLGLKGAFELKQKQHGQQDQGHMVVPAAPADDLVFIQAGQAFGILQGTPDPIAARLPLGQEAGLGFLRIEEAVFGLRAVQLLAYNQPDGLAGRASSMRQTQKNMKSVKKNTL